MGRRRSRVEMTRQSLTRSTLMFLRQLSGHSHQIDCITYNSRRHHILTADDSTMRLWSLRKEMKKVSLPRLKECAQPARFLDLLYYNKQDLYLVLCGGDPKSGTSSYAGYVLGYRAGLLPALEFPAHSDAEIAAGAFHDGREELVTCDTNGCLNIWAFASMEAGSKQSGGNGKNHKSRNDDSAEPSGTLQVFHKSSLHLDVAHPVQALHLDDSSHICGPYHFAFVGCKGGVLIVVDLASNRVLCTADCQAKGGSNAEARDVVSIAFSQETQHILVGFSDGNVDLFVLHRSSSDESHSLILLNSFACHEGGVTDVVFVPHVNGVLSCGKDNLVRHWKPPTCGEVGRYQHLHQPAPLSHVAHNRRLQHVDVRKILPVKIEVDAMCSKQLLLIVTGELVTIIEVLSPCLSFAEPQGGEILGVQAVVGSIPPISFDPSIDRAAVQRGHHHVVSLSQGNAISIFDAADGRQAFSFALPERKEYDSHEDFHVRQQQRNKFLQATGNGDVLHTSSKALPRLEDGGSRPSSRGSAGRPSSRDSARRPNSRGSLGLAPPLPANNAVVCKYLWCPVQTLHAVGWSDGKVELIDSNAEIKHKLVNSHALAAVKAMCVVQTSGPEAKRVRRLQLEITPPLGYQPLDPDSEMARSSEAMPDNSEFRKLNRHIRETVKSDDPFVGALLSRRDTRLQSPSLFHSNARMNSKEGLRGSDRILNQLVTGSIDGLLRVWQVETEKLWHTIRAHSGSVVDIILVDPVPVDQRFGSTSSHPRVQCILTAGNDGFVKLWSIGDLSLMGFAHVAASARCEQTERIRTPSAGARSSVSSIAALPRCGLFIIGFENGVVQSWSLPMPRKQRSEEHANHGTGKDRGHRPFHGSATPHASHHVHAKRVSQISASFTQPNAFLSASQDHTVMLWCVREDNKLDPVRRMTFPAPIQSASFTPVCDEIIVSWGNSLSVVSYWEQIDKQPDSKRSKNEILENRAQQSDAAGSRLALQDQGTVAQGNNAHDKQNIPAIESLTGDQAVPCLELEELQDDAATLPPSYDSAGRKKLGGGTVVADGPLAQSSIELGETKEEDEAAKQVSILAPKPSQAVPQSGHLDAHSSTANEVLEVPFGTAFPSEQELNVSASAPALSSPTSTRSKQASNHTTNEPTLTTLMPVQVEVLRSAFARHSERTNDDTVPTKVVADLISSLGWVDLKMHVLHAVAEGAKIDLLRPRVDLETVFLLTDAFLVSSEAEYLLGRRARNDYEEIAQALRSSTANKRQLHKRLDKKYKEMCKTRAVIKYNSMGERMRVTHRDLNVPEDQPIHTRYTKPEGRPRVYESLADSTSSQASCKVGPCNFVPEIQRLPANFLTEMSNFYGESVASKVATLNLQARWISRLAAHKLLKQFVHAKQLAGPVISLEQCIVRWHKHKYGNGMHLWHVVAERLVSFLEAIRLHAKSGDAICQTYAWFLGVSPDGRRLDNAALKIYLQTRAKLNLSAQEDKKQQGKIRARNQYSNAASDASTSLATALDIFREALQDPIHWRVLSAVEKALIQHTMDLNQCENMDFGRLIEFGVDGDFVPFMFLREYVTWGPKPLQGSTIPNITASITSSSGENCLFEHGTSEGSTQASQTKSLPKSEVQLSVETNVGQNASNQIGPAATADSPTSVSSPASGSGSPHSGGRRKRRKKPTGQKYKGLTGAFVPGESSSFSLASTFVGNSSGEAMYLFSTSTKQGAKQMELEPELVHEMIAQHKREEFNEDNQYDTNHMDPMVRGSTPACTSERDAGPQRPESRGRLKRQDIVQSYISIERSRPVSSESRPRSRGLAGVVMTLDDEDKSQNWAPSVAHYRDPSLRFDQKAPIIIEREYPTGRSSICTRRTEESRPMSVHTYAADSSDLSCTDTDSCSEAESSEDGRLLPSPLARLNRLSSKRASVSMAGHQQKLMQDALVKRAEVPFGSPTAKEQAGGAEQEGSRLAKGDKSQRRSSTRRESAKDAFGERCIGGNRQRRPSSAEPRRSSFSLSTEFFEETRRSLAATLPPERQEEANRKRRLSMNADVLCKLAEDESRLEELAKEEDRLARYNGAVIIQAIARGFMLRIIMERCAPIIDPEYEDSSNQENSLTGGSHLPEVASEAHAITCSSLRRKSSMQLFGAFKRASSSGALRRASLLAKQGSLDASQLIFNDLEAQDEIYDDSSDSDGVSPGHNQRQSRDDESVLLQSIEPSITFDKCPPEQHGSVADTSTNKELGRDFVEAENLEAKRSKRSIFASGSEKPTGTMSDSQSRTALLVSSGADESQATAAEINGYSPLSAEGDAIVQMGRVKLDEDSKHTKLFSPQERASRTTQQSDRHAEQSCDNVTQDDVLVDDNLFDQEWVEENSIGEQDIDALVDLEELVDRDLMEGELIVIGDDDEEERDNAVASEIMADTEESCAPFTTCDIDGGDGNAAENQNEPFIDYASPAATENGTNSLGDFENKQGGRGENDVEFSKQQPEKPSLIPTDPEVIKNSNQEMLALLQEYTYKPDVQSRNMEVQHEDGAPELVSRSNCFGEPIRFAPLTLMKQSDSLPHWQEDENADEDDAMIVEEDTVTKQFVDVGNLDFLYNIEKEKESSVTTAPPIEGFDVSSWTNFFKSIEDMLRPPANAPVITDLDRQEARLKEIKQMLRLKGLEVDAPEDISNSRFMELKEPERAQKMWKKIRNAITATSGFRDARKERAQHANSGQLVLNTIEMGTPISGEVDGNQFAYFRFSLTEAQTKSFVTVSIDSIDGDPDLFLSNETIPTVKDFTWRTSAVGNRRIVLHPGSANFVAGDYFIGIFSLIPAAFRVVIDIQRCDYGSDALDNVATLTNKFNVIASMKTGGKTRTTMQEFYEKEQREKERAERKRVEKEKRAQERRDRMAEARRLAEIEEESDGKLQQQQSSDSDGPLLEHIEPGNGAMDDTFTDHFHDQDEKFERMVIRVGRRELRANQFEFAETASTTSTEDSSSSAGGSFRGNLPHHTPDRLARDFGETSATSVAEPRGACDQEETPETVNESNCAAHEASPVSNRSAQVVDAAEVSSQPNELSVKSVEKVPDLDNSETQDRSHVQHQHQDQYVGHEIGDESGQNQAEEESGLTESKTKSNTMGKELEEQDEAFQVPVIGDQASVSTFDAESMLGDLIDTTRKSRNSRPHFLCIPKPVNYAVSEMEGLSKPRQGGASGTGRETSASLMGGVDASMYRCKRGFETYRENKSESALHRLFLGLSGAGLVFPEEALPELLSSLQGLELERTKKDGSVRARSLKFQRFFDVYEHIEAKLIKEKCELVSEQKQLDQEIRQFPYRESPKSNKFKTEAAPKVLLAVGPRAKIEGAQIETPKVSADLVPNLAKLYAKDAKQLEAAKKRANGRAQKHIRAERRELLLRRKLGDAAYEALKANGGGF